MSVHAQAPSTLIDKYHVERLDRNKFGGGVAFYVHKSIDYKVRNDLMIYDLESISVEMKIGMHKPFIVTSRYSPNHTVVEYFSKLESLIAIIFYLTWRKDNLF